MAAAHGPPAIVPPAAPSAVFYRDFFADGSNDPFAGEYTAALAPYLITGGGAALTPANVRDLIANARLQGTPTAFLLQHEDDHKLHIYVQLERFDRRMGLPVTPYDGNMYASKGELRRNQHQTVHFEDDRFNQTANMRIPTANLVDAEIAAAPNADILGPYNAGDADTEVIRTRFTCFVPAPYVSLFLAKPLTPREAWDTVRGQIVTDGREAACEALIQYLRAAFTVQAGTATGVQVTVPVVPLSEASLEDRRQRILEQDFPALNPALRLVHNQQIVNHLGQLVLEQQQSRQDKKDRAQAAKNKPPEEFLGPVATTRLLRYSHVATPAEFAPFWFQIARSPKSQHLNILQWEVNRIKAEVGEPDLPFHATAPLLEVLKSLHWEMSCNDSVNTGFNNFLLADAIMDTALGSLQLYELLHSDGANPTLADATALVRAKAGAPHFIYQSRQQMKRFEIATRIVLSSTHPLPLALNDYNRELSANESKLHQLQAEHLLLPTMLCKRVAVQASNWFRRQVNSPAPIPVPNFISLFDDIRDERPWQPAMTPAFLSVLNLLEFRSPLPRTPRVPGGGVTPNPNADNPPPPSPQPGGADLAQRDNNVAFNSTLFERFKDSRTPCRIVRSKIQRGELPALPMSKGDPTMEVCLAWHVKGMCNANCSRSADHVPYTDAEYAPLHQWCTQHWPSS